MRNLIVLILGIGLTGCADSESAREVCDGDDLVVPEHYVDALPSKAEMNAGVKSLLTVEESLGLACRSTQARSTHLFRGVNPEAMPQIVELLRNPNHVGIRGGVIRSLAYVGENAEALLLEKMLLVEQSETESGDKRVASDAVFSVISLMARRGVPEAERIVNEAFDAEYPTLTPRSSNIVVRPGKYGISRHDVLYATVIADWEVNEVLIAELANENRNFAADAERDRLSKLLCRASAAETQKITQKERDELTSLYVEHFGKINGVAIDSRTND